MDRPSDSAQPLPEGLFQALLRRSLDGIVLLDRESRRFIEFSDSWCEMTGFTREELLGRTGAELGLTRAAEQALIQRRVAAGIEGCAGSRIWGRDGQPRWLEFSTQHLWPDLDLSLVRDITDRHEMQEMTERYQLLVE